MNLTLFMFVWCFLGAIKGESCDGNHTILPWLDERVSDNSTLYSERLVSDYFLPNGWYDVGKRNMPTDPRELRVGSSCGTRFPIWMNGTIPQTSEGKVNRTACVLTNWNVCEHRIDIQVINCGTHMLYNLSKVQYNYYTPKPTDDDYFNAAYCFDPSELSAVSLKVQPWLYFADETGVDGQDFKKPHLMFRCQLIANVTDDLYYSVSWYVNDIFLQKKGPVLLSDIGDTDLIEHELIQEGHKLDINIKCVVNTSNSTEGSFENNTTTSPQFWLGIRVLNPTVQIVQGKTATIQLQPTFPFGCSSRAGDLNMLDKCLLSVHMFDPDDSYTCERSSISVQESQKCGVEIPGFYHHQWTDGARYDNVTEMIITTKDPTDYHTGRNTFVLKLLTGGTGLNDIVQGNYLSNITVTSTFETAWQAKMCYSYIDPHMRSFDGRYYENQNLGVFVMYRHNSSKQEVQMKTKQCYSVATCACAVAVRAGGDIFLIDVCRSPGLIKHVSCKENILDIRQITPYSYQIHMPLGTMASVTIYNWQGYESTLNLIIYPSVKDIDKTQGLCGVLNHNEGDDFMTPSGGIEIDNNVFSTSWRIDHEYSYFDPRNHDPDLSQLWDQSSLFCVCPASFNSTTPPSTQSSNEFVPLCTASVYSACTKKPDLQGTPYQACNIRTKRSKQSVSIEIQRILDKEIMGSDIRTHSLVKRSTLNITIEEALKECTRFFKDNCTTSLFENSLPSSNQDSKNSSITNCALDYTYIGDMSLASLHCETYRSEVDEEIRRNSTFREEKPEVVKSFRATACINNCYSHGNCVNGSCICHEQYIEEDCSVSLRDYPAVEDTYAGGLCQKNKDVCCGELPIYGSRFVRGITKQNLQTFQIYINGTLSVENTTVENLTIINPFEAEINVPCGTRKRRSIPFVTGIRVSLTNDGKNYSSIQTYFTYDSKCQGVSNSTDGYIFYLLHGTCFIGDACYIEGERDTSDSCRRCLPSVDPYSWSNGCTSSNDDARIAIIVVSVCVGVLVIIFAITPIIIFRCCVQKKKSFFRIAGHFQGNATSTMPGSSTMNLTFSNQQNLRESGKETE